MDAFKRGLKLNLFFLESNQDSKEEDTLLGNFDINLFKVKSSFNLAGPFQPEFLFSCIEHELQVMVQATMNE